MDLTYMPGELDYKNTKKDEGSAMKRDHDSADDFEHLDPELSPVDVQSKGFTGLEKFDKSEIKDKSAKKTQHITDPFSEGISSDGVGKLPSISEPLADNFKSGKDFSDLDMKSHQLDKSSNLVNEGRSSLLDFGINQDFSHSSGNDSIKDILNTSFISAEMAGSIEKTEPEHESDLLSLGNKAEDGVKEVQELPPPTGHGNNSKDLGLVDIDNSKSMKEVDAFSQYDIKPEKKETVKKDDTLTADKHDPEPFIKPDKPDSEHFIETRPESALNKPKEELSESQPDIPKPESDKTKVEPVKEHDITVNESTDVPSEKDDVPLEPFICICPSKPPSAKETTHETSLSDLDDIIGPDDVFKRIGLDAWFTPDRLHPIVEALVYWRDPKKSGVVFGGIMAILLSLCYMSLISVVAYSSLLALAGTICFRIYKNILQAVQKTSEGHPFKDFLELELSLPQDKVREMVDIAVVHINAAIVELRRLFLVEDLIDSIKFGVCLWCLTYVGAIFNGMTLVILAFVALFTVPKIYENNKASIDTYIDMGRSKVAEITSKVKAAVPIGKKEPEKDKEQ